MTLLQQALAAGVFVAIQPTGAALLAATGSPLESAGRLSRMVAATATGTTAWSALLLVAAIVDQFHPEWLGTLGWCLTVAYLAWRWHGRAQAAAQPAGVPVSRVTVLAAVALFALGAAMSAGFPKESLLAERDEAIYTLHALHLLRTGTDRIDMRALGLADSATAQAIGADKRLELPGIYPTGDRWTFQFSALPSVWIAQLAAVAGDAGLFRLNLAVTVLSGLALLALLLEWLSSSGRVFAGVGLAAFLFNPAQVWISRVNLSEPLAQWFTLSGLLLAVLALRQRNTRLAGIAGVVLAMSFLTRLDALLTLLLVAAAWPVAWLTGAAIESDRRPWTALSLAAAGTSGMGLAYYSIFVSPYWRQHTGFIWPLLLAGAAIAAVCVAVAVRPRSAVPSRWLRRSLICVAVGLTAAFCYAAWIRPEVPWFALIDSPLVPSLQGQRDYRELALPNLAAYLGWPLVVIALAGYLTRLMRLEGKPVDPGTVLLGCVGVGTSLVFLWNPMVSPDHVWASRRFIPVVIPLAILFATAFLADATTGLGAARVRIWSMALAVTIAAHFLFAQRDTLGVAEDAGLLAALRGLEEQLPDGQRVFVAGGSTLPATLIAGFGKSALPLLEWEPDWRKRAAKEIADDCSAQRPCWWLDGGDQPRFGLVMQPVGLHRLPRIRIAGTPVALARDVTYGGATRNLYRLQGIETALPDRFVGEHFDWRLSESGFWGDETGVDGTQRWTNGEATLRVPALASRAVEVSLHVQFPTTLAIDLDGTTVFDGAVAAGEWTHAFAPPAADADAGESWTIVLRSDPFIPADRWGGEDRRPLGVRLKAIRLLAPVPPPDWTPGRPLRADLSVQDDVPTTRRPPDRVTLRLRNSGDWTWRSAHDTGPGRIPVQIGILWLSKGESLGGKRHAEQRVTLPRHLEPEEDLLLAFNLNAVAADGSALPAGDYDVIVSPVLEGVAWFHDEGVAPVRIAVRVGDQP